ncbi:hypothetical protein GYMLUDRAFT_249313 [Collybiopsis luxurians FD-317 M1]|uniref:Transcription factor CBF/NF-Y/archaeal histone domain-containing protein n=1 Tax=Collybiopsis luxurians FD-317 M1 TaxID=944289 RepID=A0A0D0BII6_9AGAR|nr:hypothetical protein GYMLUDRAFT_249313 [Collybiopsis luxurians FD-317 M1]
MAPTSSQQQPFVRAGEHLNEFLPVFWQRQIDAAEQESSDYRHPILPLARIKKVMKSDPDVKMIAADAPILFCKACEIFIEEITARAFIIADSNKRRTLSRSDIAAALSKSDQFDFLIDIVPRDLQRAGNVSVGAGTSRKNTGPSGPAATGIDAGAGTSNNTQDVQSYRDSETSVVGKSEIVEQASVVSVYHRQLNKPNLTAGFSPEFQCPFIDAGFVDTVFVIICTYTPVPNLYLILSMFCRIRSYLVLGRSYSALFTRWHSRKKEIPAIVFYLSTSVHCLKFLSPASWTTFF